MKTVQEKKYTKRLGWITLLNAEIVSKLPNYADLFDHTKISIRERLAYLATIPGAIERQVIFENITPIVGFEVITKFITGNLGTLAEGLINVHSVGTGTTPPADADTQLQTEIFRKNLASVTYAGNQAFYTAVYETTEANGALKEMGLFMNGSAGVPNSGTMWDRSAIDIAKTIAQSLTIDYEDTFIND